ncbi:MAG: hypothetical protein JXA25_07240 [Anaerolineales bacterium]|nr:hypothetical protein [Anaerolineales bacterium]
MKEIPDIQYVSYQQAGEQPRRAAFIPVECDFSGLSERDLQVVGHLIEAVEAINPIFRDQFDPRTAQIQQFVLQLLDLKECSKSEKETLEDYLQILNLQNSPFSLLPRKNNLLQIPRDRMQALAELAGPEAEKTLSTVSNLFYEDIATPDFANFYPPDFREEDFTALGSDATIVNSRVVRGKDGTVHAVLNEEIYQSTLKKVIEHLRAARNLVTNLDFSLYLDAKIVEMQTGSEEARRVADAAWIRHRSTIDIVISSALEVYLDAYKNIRGAATGGVFLRNEAAEELLAAVVERVPRFEYEAPWTWKKETVNPDNLPHLKFVDVLSWTGDYVTGPNTTLAQSLPNDRWVTENVGTVNMVFNNTTRAVSRVTGRLMAVEFFAEDQHNLIDLLFEGNQLHSALHEIGHTTGIMDPEHSTGQPSDYLEEEYSWLEETRAELFGLWVLPLLVEDGIISSELAAASRSGFLLTLLGALRFEPVQAHTMARNLIFHSFEEQNIIVRNKEHGRTRYALDADNIHTAVTGLLKTIADIKAAGDKPAAVRLRERLMFPDPRREELDQRTSELPLGRGLIFPQLEKEGNRFLPESSYVSKFYRQPVFKHTLEP